MFHGSRARCRPPLIVLEYGPHCWLQDHGDPWHGPRAHLAWTIILNEQHAVEAKLDALRAYYVRWGRDETVAALRLAHRQGRLEAELLQVLRQLTRPLRAA